MIKEINKKKIITSLCNDVINNQYPLSYDSDYKLYNFNENYNCYAYALGLKTKNTYLYLKWEGLSIYNPGTISSFKNIVYDDKNLIEAILSDCEVLGLEVYNFGKIIKNSFNVFVYLANDELDFHFVRENRDGTLSNMKSIGGKVFRLDSLDISNYHRVKSLTLRRSDFYG